MVVLVVEIAIVVDENDWSNGVVALAVSSLQQCV